MDLIMTIVVGAVVGWLVSILTKATLPMGTVTAVVVGIVGAFLGIACVRSLMGETQGALLSQTIAAVGAALGVVTLRWLSSPLGTPRQRRAKR